MSRLIRLLCWLGAVRYDAYGCLIESHAPDGRPNFGVIVVSRWCWQPVAADMEFGMLRPDARVPFIRSFTLPPTRSEHTELTPVQYRQR